MKKVYLIKFIQLILIILGIFLASIDYSFFAIICVFLSIFLTFILPTPYRKTFRSRKKGLFFKEKSIFFKTVIEIIIDIVIILYIIISS